MARKRGGKKYRPWEPERYRDEVYRPVAKLAEGDLVFFLIDTVKQLDLSQFYAPYEQETRGAPPFDPAMLVCLLLYAYCVGVFTSRKIAQACERNLAFLAIVGEERPDFRTLSDFRKQHLEAFAEVFVQVLRIAGEAGLVKLGNVSTDGTKVQGNASRHKAMSYGHMKFDFIWIQRLKKGSVDRFECGLFFFNLLMTVEVLIPKTPAVSRTPLPLRAISIIFCLTSGKRPA